MPSDSSAVLLNKAAVEAMNLKHPLGMEMRFGDDKYNVIGVTENVVMESPFHPVDPMLVFYNPAATSVVSISVKQGAAMPKTIQHFEAIFKKYNTAFPFDYSFADAEFSRKFITEDLIGKITNIFAGLAIFHLLHRPCRSGIFHYRKTLQGNRHPENTRGICIAGALIGFQGVSETGVAGCS